MGELTNTPIETGVWALFFQSDHSLEEFHLLQESCYEKCKNKNYRWNNSTS